MLIGFEKRFVFVASTKTASTSLEQVLRPHTDIVRTGTAQRKHIALRDIFPTYDFLFSQPDFAPDSFFKFGVMRDPLDWIRSWYRYRLGNEVESPLPEGMSFAEFWARKDWNILHGDGRKNLQRNMFVDYDGQVLADVIIPYDRLDDMFRDICTAFGMPQALPRANVSRIRQTEPLPPALEAELREFYAEDYALYAELEAINAEGMARLRDGRGGFRAAGGKAGAGSAPVVPDRHVFVFSYCPQAGGAIQAALNDLPGYCIRGVTGDTALHLMRAEKAVATQPGIAALRQSGNKTDAADPLYGAEKMKPWAYGQALAKAFTQTILTPPAGTKVAGCRSTFWPENANVLKRYVDFLSEHFAQAQILFVTRNPADVAARQPDEVHSIDAFYRACCDSHPERCHVIDYDLWQSQSGTDLMAVLDQSA